MSRAVALCLGLVLACGAEDHEVRLLLGEGDTGLHGFMCKKDADPSSYLAERVIERQPPAASLVFDFVRLGGVPGCRSSQLLSWCVDHDCGPIRRTCIDLDLSLIDPSSPDSPWDELVASLGGQVLAADAPDEPVLIRAIGVAAPCAEVPTLDAPDPRLPCGTLFGCVYSCPIQLDQTDDDIVLDLDVFGDRCEQAVDVCANGLTDQAACP